MMTNKQAHPTWWQWLQAVWSDGNPIEILSCLEAVNPDGSSISVDEVRGPGRGSWFRVRILDGAIVRNGDGVPSQALWPEGRFLWMREDEVKRVAAAVAGVVERAEREVE